MNESKSDSDLETQQVETLQPSLQEQDFVRKAGDIPVVKTAVEKITSLYHSARERNHLTKVSFAAAELSFWTAIKTSQFAYSLLPNSGPVGKVKQDFERGVASANRVACRGLDAIQDACPSLMGSPEQAIHGIAEITWVLTKTGFKVTSELTWETVSRIPGLSHLLPAHPKLRRSTRRRRKTKPEDVVRFPFPTSPERKRKRSTGGSEEGTIEELLYITNDYDSDADPDYQPSEDESSDESESGEGDSGEGDEDVDDGHEDLGGQALTPVEVGRNGGKIVKTDLMIVNVRNGDREKKTVEQKEPTKKETKAMEANKSAEQKIKKEDPKAKDTKEEIQAVKLREDKLKEAMEVIGSAEQKIKKQDPKAKDSKEEIQAVKLREDKLKEAMEVMRYEEKAFTAGADASKEKSKMKKTRSPKGHAEPPTTADTHGKSLGTVVADLKSPTSTSAHGESHGANGKLISGRRVEKIQVRRKQRKALWKEELCYERL
ncbi:uncharacterized protein LOC5501250 isoform X2 [Nematostella vectensis]|uniref:uncharacterized protein LOC5501250 isoform X2 n=1 Tax=Nematostella vectensis TaxID=45351 RepID=UPI0020772CE2|nr:uncharacterized protein LOC5501250 isoform X2 [Nematostella vectensis]